MFIDQDKEFDIIKISNLGSASFNRNPGSDNNMANTKDVHELLDSDNFLKSNQTLENYLELSVGNHVSNLS